MHLSARLTVAVFAALAACLATGCSGSSSLRSAQCPAKTGTGQVNLGFLRQYWLPSGAGGGGPVYGPCTADTPADIQLDWANSDATLILGELKLPGHSLFGLFSGGKLTALPAPPAGLSATAW